MPTHSSMLAWGISMGRETWRTIVHGVEESQDMTGRQQESVNHFRTHQICFFWGKNCPCDFPIGVTEKILYSFS